MKAYISGFLGAGVILPIALHISSPALMPWWPDTVSMGIAFGVAAVVIVWKNQKDRETRRRFWNALRAVGEAVGRRGTSR